MESVPKKPPTIKEHLRMEMSLSKLWELMMESKAWRGTVHQVTKS